MENHPLAYQGYRTFFNDGYQLRLQWINLEYQSIVMAQKTGKQSMKPFFLRLDEIGEILQQTTMISKIFVSDEIGFLEQFSLSMQRGIIKAITDAPFSIMTLKKENYPFLKQIIAMDDLILFDLDEYDRHQKDALLQKIMEIIQTQVK